MSGGSETSDVWKPRKNTVDTEKTPATMRAVLKPKAAPIPRDARGHAEPEPGILQFRGPRSTTLPPPIFRPATDNTKTLKGCFPSSNNVLCSSRPISSFRYEAAQQRRHILHLCRNKHVGNSPPACRTHTCQACRTSATGHTMAGAWPTSKTRSAGMLRSTVFG